MRIAYIFILSVLIICLATNAQLKVSTKKIERCCQGNFYLPTNKIIVNKIKNSFK